MLEEPNFFGTLLRHHLVQIFIFEIDCLNHASLSVLVQDVDSIANRLREVHDFGRPVHLKFDRSALQVFPDQAVSKFLSWRHYCVAPVSDMRWNLFKILRLKLSCVVLVRLFRRLMLHIALLFIFKGRPHAVESLRVHVGDFANSVACRAVLDSLDDSVHIGVDASFSPNVQRRNGNEILLLESRFRFIKSADSVSVHLVKDGLKL